MAGLEDVPDDWLCQRARRAPLRPPLVELHLVHGPNGPLNVLHAHETFVQRQVVAHCILTTKHRQINNATWTTPESAIVSLSTEMRCSFAYGHVSYTF